MRSLFLRLYYVYARILTFFYFIGYFIWYWRKPENAYQNILDIIEEACDNKYRYSTRRYDEKAHEKFKITSSIIVTSVLTWLIIAIIFVEVAFIILAALLLLTLFIFLIYLMISL